MEIIYHHLLNSSHHNFLYYTIVIFTFGNWNPKK